MKSFFEYTLLFIISVLVQVLLFNNIELSWWIYPVIFPLFVILLPVEMSTINVMLLAMLQGVAMDFLTAVPGLNTATMLAVGVLRRSLLLLFVGRQAVQDGGVPLCSRIGNKHFLKYVTSVMLLFFVLFYGLEKLNVDSYWVVLIQVLASTMVSVPLIFVLQLLFANRKNGF